MNYIQLFPIGYSGPLRADSNGKGDSNRYGAFLPWRAQGKSQGRSNFTLHIILISQEMNILATEQSI